MTNPRSTMLVRDLPVIRVFVSSTFSDLVAERNALAKDVWPKLEGYCRQRGFTFQAIDLRWGVPSEAGLDHRTMRICFEELHRAQATSPEPNFLILLGDKYGWRPLPEAISETEYNRLYGHTLSPAEQAILVDWYRRDSNGRPTHYVLRARTDSPDGADYTRVTDVNGRLQDTSAWLAVQETLWSIVNRAYPGTLLSERFTQGTDEIPASVRFQGSATEQEIWHGALQVEKARDHVVAWFREIDRTGRDPEPSQLKRFIDLRPDESPDADADAALDQLKIQVKDKLKPEPIIRATCAWEKDSNGKFTGEVTTEHLTSMCEAILTRLRKIVIRQINAYWGVDLSAEDATVAAVRGSQRELDLELRAHGRFAEERGPVDHFVGRDNEVGAIREYLQSTTNRPLIVHGPSGSGKTALLAYVAQLPFPTNTKSQGVTPLILTRFIGSHPESSTLRGLLTSLCRELRGPFPVTTTDAGPDGQEQTVPTPLPDTIDKLIEEFYAQLGRATNRQPIYVFLDALDQLDAADAGREVDWIRSPLLRLDAPSALVYARLVASCLSPSREFPPDSEPCRPYVRLKSRHLLAEAELGALQTGDAQALLRDWLAAAHRGLTDVQWQIVDTAIAESAIDKFSARRQPLYLKVLVEQLACCRDFDAITELPLDLSQLIESALRRLGERSQHGPLLGIALSYIVSARYGLSEGELLEVLYRDPEIRDQLKKARKEYGHKLPKRSRRFPIAPWARLRSDLRFFLSERAAPGATVLSCYHRQVEQAVRKLFLAEDVTRQERLCRLAAYFDLRWDQPDAHALMELPALLLALPDHRRLYDRLTNFAFPMRKAEVGLLESISTDYNQLNELGPPDIQKQLAVWKDFYCKNGHILRRGLEGQTVHRILLGLALEHADNSPLTQAAEAWLAQNRCNWFRLQRAPRLVTVQSDPCLNVLEGHTGFINGALILSDGCIVSWGQDKTLRVWDDARGVCLRILNGHHSIVVGALSSADHRIVSWSTDYTLRLWDAAAGTCLSVLKGHTDFINGALSLPDGKTLSWSEDRSLRVWDTSTGTCLRILEGHIDRVTGALSLSDGRILSWADDNTLRLWNLADGACLKILRGHMGDASGALSLNDGRILSWSWDKTLRLWDTSIGDCLGLLEGHTDSVLGALLLPDGRILSWSHDMTLRIWDVTFRECAAVLSGHTGSVFGAHLLSDGRILSWSGDKTLRLWNATTGECGDILEGHSESVTGSLLLTDGRVVSWSRKDRTIRLWDVENAVRCIALEAQTDWIGGVVLLDSSRIVSWSSDTLRLWDAATIACDFPVDGHADSATGVLSLPDGQVLSWSKDTTLRLWDAETGICRRVLRGHKSMVGNALSLSDSRILSWAGDLFSRDPLLVWDAATGDCLHVLEGHAAGIDGCLPLSDGKFLSRCDATLRLYDSLTGACLRIFEGHSSVVDGVLSLPRGRLLSWSWDKTLRLWDATTGECHDVLDGHTNRVTGALLMPDNRILSWSWDHMLRLWDAATGTCVNVLEGHTGSVEGASLFSDGRILSWSEDRSLRVWDATTGACLSVLVGHTDSVKGAWLLSDRRILSWSDAESWSRDQTLRLWNAATGECLALLKESDAASRHPEWLHARTKTERPDAVALEFFATTLERTADLRHKSVSGSVAAWQAESKFNAECLRTDGTLVVTQANGQVCFLKLYYGNRRVSLPEAEDILRSTGQVPQSGLADM